MSRTPVSLRQAVPADVPFLLELWPDVLRRGDRHEQTTDLEIIVKEAAQSAEQRVLVADYDGEPAGAVYLQVTTMTPLDREPVVLALAPFVETRFRRKGVGRALMDAAVTWAEDLGVGHVLTAAAAGSRSGNRFLARLSLAQQAVLRVAPTHAVRAKLTALAPGPQRPTGRRSVSQVLVARRQLSRRHAE